MRLDARRLGLATTVLGAVLLIGCGAGQTPDASPRDSGLPSAAPAAVTAAAGSAESAVAGAVPSAEAQGAILVAADYRPPRGRVDSTGAYVPSNGKPTLVFVDAIW